MKSRRAISNIIIATLVFTALALTLPVMLLYTYVSGVTNEIKAISYLEVEERARYVDVNVTALIDEAGNLYVVVFNRGGRQVDIERVLVLTHCGEEGLLMGLPNSEVTLTPGTYREYVITPSQLPCSGAIVNGIYIVTSEPRVYSAKLYNITEMRELFPGTTQEKALPPQSYRLFPVTQVSEPWNISKTLSDGGFILAMLDDPYRPTKLSFSYSNTVISEGMNNSRGTWQRTALLENVRVKANNVNVRNVILGYDPRDPSKYVIMLTNDGSIGLEVNSRFITYCSGMLATRIKIYGFISSNPQGVLQVFGDSSRFGTGGVWVKTPSQDIATYMFLNGSSRGKVYLEGSADRVEIYCLGGPPGVSSYEPYILFTNTVRRYASGALLFNTIDAIWGYQNTQGDSGLLDKSRYPLALLFMSRELDINNNNTRAVLITINYRFFDNSFDDSGDDFSRVTEDRPIILVGVVDEGGNVVAFRSFSFRELTRYENTYPPTTEAQSAVAFIPIPTTTSVGLRKFYVFLSIQDPYLGSNYVNDVDVMVLIDSIEVILYS